MRSFALSGRAALVIAVLLLTIDARAGSIVVNSTADAALPSNNGDCTLREAITAANTNAAVDGCAAGSGLSDTITFSVAGTISVTAAAPLPPIVSPLIIDGPGSGGSSQPAVRIDGAAVSSGTGLDWGLYLAAGSSGSTIRDLMITGFQDGGILIESSNNFILGNWIGTDGSTAGVGNGAASFGGAVRISIPGVAASASGNTIGGTTAADRNVIEGNSGAGVSVRDFDTSDAFDVANTIIQGNYIGTNPVGTGAGPSGGENGAGIEAFNAPNLTIGGTTGTTPGGSCTGACNLIARSSVPISLNGPSDGTFVSGLSVQGNYVGTDVSGTSALGCYLSSSCTGIVVSYGVSGTIGGTTAAARNVISGFPGSSGNGLYIFNTPDGTAAAAPFVIAGNYIGPNSAGTAVIGNGGAGIITNPAESLTIGGATPSARNVIAGNSGDGIQLQGGNDLVTTGNTIRNNYIGVLADGTTAAANGANGISATVGNTSIPDFDVISDNVIANNGAAGISLNAAANNIQIRSNSIYNNAQLGIDQNANNAVETNDHCDGDIGANDDQNYPVLTSAALSGGTVAISGTLDSLASGSFTVDFFGNTSAGDEGRIYLGSTTVNTNGACTASFTAGPFATTLISGNTVTATATNNAASNPDTSEFSAPVTAAVVLSAPIVTKTFTPSTIPTGSTSTLSIQIQNPNGSAGLSNVAFTDTYPAQITTAATPNITGNCGGTVGSTAGTFTLNGGSLAAGAACTVTIAVTSSAVGGPYTNNVSVTTAETSAGNGSAGLTVVSRPAVSKAFSPSTLAAGATSTLTISLGNTNASPITAVNLTDNFPSGLVVASPNGVVNNCGGSITATTGSGSLVLSGGSIPNGGCTIAVNVTSATAAVYTNTITTTDVTSSAGSPSSPASNTVTFTATLSGTKSFTPATIAPGGTSTLTVTLTNPGGTAATGVAFSDNYPAAMTNATTPNVSTTCSGGSLTAASGGSSLQASGLTVAANSSCTVTVAVTSVTTGTHTNTIPAGAITSSNANANGSPVTGSLTVIAPPTVAKAFNPNTLAAGGASTLTITLGNPNASAITSVNLADNFPSGLVVANPNGVVNNCGGTITAAAGAGSLSLSGGSIPSGGCTIAVNVTSATSASYTNTIATTDVTTSAGSPSSPATDKVTFTAALTATKSFAPATIAPGGASTLTITIANPNGTAATAVSFTDTYPAGVTNAATPNAATTCSGGTLTAAAGGASLQAAGMTVAASSSCTVTVSITSSTSGTHTNTIPAGGITSSSAGSTTSPATASITVNVPPAVSKSFTPQTIGVGGGATLTITLTNPNAVPLTGAAFTDTYPAGLVNANPANVATTCAGTATATPGGSTLSLSGGSIPANGACTVSVLVTASSAGALQNTLGAGAVTVTNAGPGGSATATLNVSANVPALSPMVLLLLVAVVATVGTLIMRR